LRVIPFFPVVLALKEGNISLAKTEVELKPEELRVAVAYRMLGGIGCINISIRPPRGENIADTESQTGRLIFQKFIFQRCVHASGRKRIALGIPADRPAPASASLSHSSPWREDCPGSVVAGNLQGQIDG